MKKVDSMVCAECGAEMYLDDRDYRFNGCYDNYFACTECYTSCKEEVRFGQSFREHWHSENNDARDWVVTKEIKRG